MKSNPRLTLLFCFLLAGIWAGSVVTYTISHSKRTNVRETAELRITDTAGRLFDKNKDKRTEPYDAETAPPLAPVPDDMTFPAPVTPAVPPVTAPPAAAEPSSPTDMLNGVLGSVTKLFNGEGNFSDILNIGLALFAIFGGGQAIGSDSLFKIILGLFSKKANFNAILKERVDAAPDSGTSRRRRRRNR